MKSIYPMIAILTCFSLTNSAQIQPEYIDWDTLQISSKSMLWYSETGPLMIVKIDSTEYMLDSLSSNRINPEWIQSISVFKASKAPELYGCKGKYGVIIISLKEDHIDDFFEGKKSEAPLQLKKVHKETH